MQVLLHTDCVIDILKKSIGPVLNLCREKRIQAWVLASAVPILHAQLCQTMQDTLARKALAEAKALDPENPRIKTIEEELNDEELEEEFSMAPGTFPDPAPIR